MLATFWGVIQEVHLFHCVSVVYSMNVESFQSFQDYTKKKIFNNNNNNKIDDDNNGNSRKIN